MSRDALRPSDIWVLPDPMVIRRMPRPITVRRTGAASHPWEVRCEVCPVGWPSAGQLHLQADVGALAVNTMGIGNRTHELAQIAADLHRAWHDAHGWDVARVSDPTDPAKVFPARTVHGVIV